MFKVRTFFFEYCSLFTSKDYFFWIKSLIQNIQFMVGQKHNLVGHLVLLRIFPVGQIVFDFGRTSSDRNDGDFG